MKLKLIAAIGKQGQLGLNGSMPWEDADDLKWFKEMTIGSLIVVGAKTYPTISRLQGTFGRVFVVDNDTFTKEYVLALGEAMYKNDVWIAGGGKTYQKWIDKVDQMYISQINYEGDADTFFPTIGRHSDTATGWLDYDPIKDKRPVSGQTIEVETRNGERITGTMDDFRWYHLPEFSHDDIVKYRIK